MIQICPMCGCGKLNESKIYGYECDNCGEVFETGEYGEIEIVDYSKWRECIYRCTGNMGNGKKNAKK